MVALVRAGVTATCSGADNPRYGHLDVDSNLPDARIALGGPDPKRFHRGGAGRRRSGVHRRARPPAGRRLARPGCGCRQRRRWPAVWVPDADLRDRAGAAGAGDRGRDEQTCGAAIASVADDLDDAEIVVTQQAPSGLRCLRAAHRRAAQPRRAQFRRRNRRHPAHRADAVVHRLAVRHLDRRAAPHRARRLELPAAALDARLRLRAGLRRRGLAATPRSRPAAPSSPTRCCAVAADRRRAGCRRTARCCTSTPPARCTWVRSRPPATRWRAAASQPSTPARWPSGWSKPAAAHADVAVGSEWARCRQLQLGRSAGTSRASARQSRQAARLPDRPPCWRGSRCPGCRRRRRHRAWPRTPKMPSRCTPATGCTTAGRRRWAGCRPSPTCTRTSHRRAGQRTWRCA